MMVPSLGIPKKKSAIGQISVAGRFAACDQLHATKQ
jgi:hypothetical protein